MTARVLIAEDNSLMAEMTRFNLQRAGLNVTLAETGDQAVELLAERAFDVVITDYQMPGCNGEEVCRFARESELNRDTCLMLCSAKGYELDLDRLIETYQLADVIFKPFSPRELVARIQELLETPVQF